jgi:hypothetical protein
MQTQTEQSTRNDGASTRREGRVAQAIEQQTAKLPSDLFLWTAGAAMVGSLVSQIVGLGRGRNTPPRAPLSMFIGQWVPTLLLFGVYNKLVKLHGSQPSEAGTG